jgi:fatty-acid desaturase
LADVSAHTRAIALAHSHTRTHTQTHRHTDTLTDPQTHSRSLSRTQLLTLWGFVPTRFRMKEIRRIFNSQNNGYSLSTLLSHAADEAPTVLLVRTVEGDVFGAYCSYPWSASALFLAV